ncbi:MAG: hypothetical protein RLZZ248_159 [Bacteroidota bacterium]
MENLRNLKYGKHRFLIDTMEKYGELPEMVKETVTNKLDLIKINKGEILNNIFDLSKTIFFIQNGFIRCRTHTSDKEVTTWISGKGTFILGISEIFGNNPLKERLDAIAKTELFYIDIEDFFSFIQKDFKIFQVYQKVLQDYYSRAEERVYLSKIASATDRVKYFLSSPKSKELKEIPDKYIADLLNIRPETFSRLKIID